MLYNKSKINNIVNSYAQFPTFLALVVPVIYHKRKSIVDNFIKIVDKWITFA